MNLTQVELGQKKSRNQRQPELNKNTISSNKYLNRKPEKKKKIVSLTFGGLGCKRIKFPVSATAVIHSAANWENFRGKKKREHRSKKRSKNAKNPYNVVIDVSDVCCTPPGIGSASDVAANGRPRIKPQRANQHSHLVRRTAVITDNVAASEAIHLQANVSDSSQFHRSRHRRTPQIVMFHNGVPLYRERLCFYDQHRGWRLDTDNMSYENLLVLGDRIGYECTGLQEEEILHCLSKPKASNFKYRPLLEAMRTDLRCSICQEECTNYHDVRNLNCGHIYHTDCIKKWLLQKNTCPVCKSAAMPKRGLEA